MRAIGINQPGNSEQLIVVDRSEPILKQGDLLIKVEAAGVNRTDILTRRSQTTSPEAVRLGVEVSGTILDTNGNDDFSIGDRIMGLVDGGGYAELAAMPANRAMPLPASLSFVEAAAIPEVFATAYQTLFWIGRLQENETVLIHAGASGVGTAAIQLAKKLKNARVIVTAGSQEKLDFCRDLGADVLINYKHEQFDAVIMEETQSRGVDLILDFIGASYWEKNLKSIAIDGRWVLIGTLGGFEVAEMNILALMQKRIQLTGTVLTPRPAEYKARLSQELARETLPLFQIAALKPIVDKVFLLEAVKEAHDYMEANKNIGKIILKVTS